MDPDIPTVVGIIFCVCGYSLHRNITQLDKAFERFELRFENEIGKLEKGLDGLWERSHEISKFIQKHETEIFGLLQREGKKN